MSDLAILIPVLGRPHRVEPLLASIAAATDIPHRVIFAASDQPTIKELDRLGAWYIQDEGDSWAIRINRLYKEVNEPYLFLAADDVAYRWGWFQAAMRRMDMIFGGGVVFVADLYNSAGTLALVSRNYIETLGSCFDGPGIVVHEGYRHAYVDDELRETARFHGRYGYAEDSVVEHLHAGAGKAPWDATYAIGNASMTQGLELYRSRSHLWGQ